MGSMSAHHGLPVGGPCDEQKMNPIFKSNNVGELVLKLSIVDLRHLHYSSF